MRVVVGALAATVILSSTVIVSLATPAAADPFQPKYTQAYGGGVMCMDVTGVSFSNGARIQQYQCLGGGNQQWSWRNSASPWFRRELVVAHSNKCLDVPNGVYYNGAPLQQYTCTGGREQAWKTSGCSYGWCRIEFTNGSWNNSGTGYCVDIPEWGYGSNGTPLTLYQCGNYYNQYFAPW